IPVSAILLDEPTPTKSFRPSGLGSRLRVQCPPGLKLGSFRPGAVMRSAPAYGKATTPSVLPTLSGFYRAFNTRDLKMMDENFAHSDEVAIDNPLGGIRRGADEPHKMYEGVFKSPADVHVEFWDYTIHRAGDVFWAVGRERGTYLDGQTVKNLNVRTTRIFQLINGRWRQMHHHGSIEDAKLLGDYQDVVRSPSPKTLK